MCEICTYVWIRQWPLEFIADRILAHTLGSLQPVAHLGMTACLGVYFFPI